MKFVNLTPHTINIISTSGTTVSIESSGLARVNQAIDEIRIDGDIKIFKSSFGEVTGIPEPEEGTGYIVSTIVASATDREDVFVPGAFVRDEAGNITGCKGLIQYNI